MTDLEKDDERTLKQVDDGYEFTSSVNYSNNSDLVSQKVYVNKNLDITCIEVLDSNNNIQMKMTIDEIKTNKDYDNNYFNIESNMSSSEVSEQSVMSELETVVYPMYVPVNTYLTSQDKVNLDNGERIILTFEGETPFMLVEETVAIEENEDTSIIYGDPHLISDTVGAVTDYSISWISNGVEYYLVSDVMEPLEMIMVAESITVSAVAK